MIRFRHARPVILAALALASAASARAHDLERTRVSLTFAADGAFVLDVANDANWLRLRLEDFTRDYPSIPAAPTGALTDAERDERLRVLAPTFIDRVVIWVDHSEVRATSAEYIAPRATPAGDAPIGSIRLRGRLPAGAHVLQWFYGLVIDPYPLVIQSADDRQTTEAILGNAWSEPIDLSRQFREPTLAAIARKYFSAGFALLLPTRNTALVLLIVALTLAASRLSPIARGVAFAAGVAWSCVLSNAALPEGSVAGLEALGAIAAGAAAAQAAIFAFVSGVVAGHRDRPWYQRRVVIPASLATIAAGIYALIAR